MYQWGRTKFATVDMKPSPITFPKDDLKFVDIAAGVCASAALTGVGQT